MCRELFEQALKSKKVLVTEVEDQITEFHVYALRPTRSNFEIVAERYIFKKDPVTGFVDDQYSLNKVIVSEVTCDPEMLETLQISPKTINPWSGYTSHCRENPDAIGDWITVDD